MVGAANSEFGGVDILVNNAAVRGHKPFVELDAASWQRAMGAAFQGAFIMSQACAPHLIARGGGLIIGMGG